MRNDIVYEEMERYGADGVDFVPIWFDEKKPVPIFAYYTKEQWETQRVMPKTNRRYWRYGEDGRKEYIGSNSHR